MVLNIRETDGAFFIDDESRAFRDTAHDEICIREKLFISNAVGFCGSVLVVAEKGDGDSFLRRPSFLSEWIVAGNGENLGVERLIGADPGGYIAKLGGADAGKGHWHEKEDDV